jgi:hypothetical protein
MDEAIEIADELLKDKLLVVFKKSRQYKKNLRYKKR